MAFVLKDRVKEETTTTGTGAISLGGTSATFDQFQSYMSNGDTTYYTISHTVAGTDEWEVGVGTWNTGNTLTRTTVLAGSNGTSAVNFSAGTKDVFMTYPADKAVFKDASGNLADVSLSNFDTDDLSEGATNQYYTDARVNSHLSGGTGVTYSDGAISIGQAVGTSDNVTFNNITSGGIVTLNADPSAALQAATKQYVDTIASAGLHYHDPVRVEDPNNLNATYDNGSSGVGATLTNAGTNAAIQLDGVTLSLNDRVLVANQTNQTQNGVYTVTTVGDGSTAWVLTRSTDTDSSAPSDPNALGKGDAFFIKEGNTNAGHLDVLTTSGTITFGTTNIVFAEVAETTVYQAGDSLTLTGTTFDTVQDIRTTASPTFAGVTAPLTGNVTGNLTGNVTGNVTGNLTGDVTGNADTATALATARDIQLSGDVTGTVSFDGSGNVNMTTAVVDDSHAHIISNVDGLQTALDGKVATSFTVTSGNGLTGGGDLTANRTLAVGAGTGVTVNADDVAIGQDVATTATVEFAGVGIGTSFPSALLHLESAGPNIKLVDSDNDSDYEIKNGNGTFRIIDTTNSADRINITSSGNVGIGGSPSYPLHVIGTGSAHQIRVEKTSSGNLNLGVDTTGSFIESQTNIPLRFYNGGSERIRIDSSGNLGINNTSPNTKLDVIGSSANGSGIVDTLRLRNTGTSVNDGARIQFTAGTSTSGAGIGSGGQALNSADLRFYAGGNTERLRIGSAGQIGLSGANYGTSGQVLTSNGSGSAPTWQNAGGGSNADTLDNLDSTQFLRSDADDTVSAGVTYSWSSTDTEGLRFTNSSYGASLYIGGWTTANSSNISRIRNSNANLHMDSGSNGNMYLNWYTSGSIECGSFLSLNGNSIGGVASVTATDAYIDDQIISYNDTDTYLQFHAADQFRVVTGGGERFEVNNNTSTFLTKVLVAGTHDLQVGDGTGNDRILIYKADNNVSDHIQFYNGTTRMGEIGCEDTSWLRINQETGKNIYTPRMIRADGGFQTTDYITHVGDTNTYMGFPAADQFTVYVGGSQEIHVNTTGVRLGDTGNGYFQPVSGNYGSIQIDGGAHGGYEGYSIGGRVVFMHNNSTASGIFNDVNNEWMVYCVNNSLVRLYHNGSSKAETTSYGLAVTGNVRSQSTAKVWTNFESIGTLSVRDSLNQSSVTDLGTGQFRSNFSSSTANSSYAVSGAAGGALPNYGGRVILPQAYATSSFRFYTEWQPANSYYDSDHINIIIIGD